MEEFNIEKPHGATRGKKVLGRGAGTGHGSTAGRGSKGQNSRAGGRTRIGFEGGQMPLYRRIARRGFSNYPFKEEYTTVPVGALEVFADGDKVTRETLADRKIVRRRVGPLKILGNGALSKRLVVQVEKVTAGARKIIEAAGGHVVGTTGAVKATGPSARPAAKGKAEAPSKPAKAAKPKEQQAEAKPLDEEDARKAATPPESAEQPKEE